MFRKIFRSFTNPQNLRWNKGEIPESLKFDREIELSTLSNGVTVASQYWEGPVATLGIMIEAGSRNETMSNSGVAHYLEHMHFKGTTKRDKHQLELDVESMGGALNAFTSRDTTLFYIEVLQENCAKGLDIISDQLLNSTYLDKYIKEECGTILREAEEVAKDMRETLLEDVHYGCFREHILGQPILGSRNAIKNINKAKLKKFILTHYLGPRIVVLGAGGILHSQLMEMAEKFVGHVPSNSEFPFDGEHHAVFTPSLTLTKDENAQFFHMAVFAPAPDWSDPDYWAFLLLQRIMGDYSSQKSVRIDSPDLIFNQLHKDLDNVQGINKHECLYIPYKDVGLFGHYMSIAHESAGKAFKVLIDSFMEYAEGLDETEVTRGKNRIYNELLGIELGSDILQTIGSQLIYMKRLVPRSEIAKRVSEYDVKKLQEVFKKYFRPNEFTIAIRGPTKEIDKCLGYIS
ncbi:hypothetical protein SteCoe_30850 [Stentor coeruleus]|uniref:Peptidase M16 N-terminal domain-containing protein n=1 Tax=Stentor coeruleus TaxID=5963 RepID=A0A1R2B352_9CILI|nr:hypothetical protein SteCoe_30850 [Stentor coeruleus]